MYIMLRFDIQQTSLIKAVTWRNVEIYLILLDYVIDLLCGRHYVL